MYPPPQPPRSYSRIIEVGEAKQILIPYNPKYIFMQSGIAVNLQEITTVNGYLATIKSDFVPFKQRLNSHND